MSFTPLGDRFTPLTKPAAALPSRQRRVGTRRPVRDAAVRRLYEKAKRLGTWDPGEINFRTDTRQWQKLTVQEQTLLLRVTSLFADGEEAVTRELLPLGTVFAGEGRLDDELFLTAWLWEEGKHADFFHRFEAGVLAQEANLGSYRTRAGIQLVQEELPAAMEALYTDSSPPTQTRALVTYCLIVEGAFAEIGHSLYLAILPPARQPASPPARLPGLQHGLSLIRRDESRHVAFGMHTLTRLQRANPATRDIARSRVETLIPLLKSLEREALASYPTIRALPQTLLDKPLQRLKRRLTHIEHAAQTKRR
jgi:ribonucleoside-diphosphate reductase beta chain